MKTGLLTLTCAATLAAPLAPAVSQSAAPTTAEAVTAAVDNLTNPYILPADAAWGMVFDPAKIRSSVLAERSLAYLSDAQRQGLDAKIDGISNMLGINLREDLGQIIAFGKGFAPDDVAVAVDVGDATTNLEGLMLADEHYESYEYQDMIIHSVQGEPDNPRVYCAVLAGDQETRGAVLLSPAAGTTEQLVNAVRSGAAVGAEQQLGESEFLRMWVADVPEEMFENTPRQSNIAKMIESLELVGSTDAADTQFKLNLTMGSPARARQIYQMAAGGKALIEFAASQDAEAAKLADLLAYVSIGNPSGEKVVAITAKCSTGELTTLLDMLEQAGAFAELKLEE